MLIIFFLFLLFQHVYYYHSFTAWPRCKWYDRKFSFHCREADVVLDTSVYSEWHVHDEQKNVFGNPGNNIRFLESNSFFWVGWVSNPSLSHTHKSSKSIPNSFILFLTCFVLL